MKILPALLFFLHIVTAISAQNATDAPDQPTNSRVETDTAVAAQASKDSLLRLTTDRINILGDSLRAEARTTDSLKEQAAMIRRKEKIAAVQQVLTDHPFYDFDGRPRMMVIEQRKVENHDGIFYYILGLVLYLALMRLMFPKYMNTMFTLFFRATLRQQQLREQMLQAPLASLLMNLFFVASLATYCVLAARYAGMAFAGEFWVSLLYLSALIAAIYIGKYIVLNITGWIFDIRQVTDTYLFIVFLVNKVLGVFLLPVIVLMAFPTPVLLPAVVLISYFLIGSVFAYRFIIAFRPLRSEIKLTRFHFFLYICAFEIAPLLLIYKVLLDYAVSSI